MVSKESTPARTHPRRRRKSIVIYYYSSAAVMLCLAVRGLLRPVLQSSVHATLVRLDVGFPYRISIVSSQSHRVSSTY